MLGAGPWLGGTHLRAVLVVLAVLLDQRTGHSVQELLGEARSAGPAGGVHHLLAAVKVALEAAAENLDVVVLLGGRGDLSL